MSGPLIFLAVEVAVVVCAALVALRALMASPGARAAQLIALIAVNTACSTVLAHQDYGYWIPAAFRIQVGAWAPALNLARNLTPGLIMVLCHALFAEDRRFPRWLLGLFAVQLALEAPFRTLLPAAVQDGPAEVAAGLLQGSFVLSALWWTLAGWRGDLVESRRRTRAGMLTVIGVTTLLAVLLTRVLIDQDTRANYVAHMVMTATNLTVLVAVLFQLMDGDLERLIGQGRRARGRRAEARIEDAAALARLRTLLAEERVCEEPDLTLADLAARLSLPVYRLRRLIHEGLGYQNFNGLLHDHRVKAACVRLADPAERRTPILTIALSVGYSSVNTFNRGFRDVMAVTPSAYRSAALTRAGQARP